MVQARITAILILINLYLKAYCEETRLLDSWGITEPESYEQFVMDINFNRSSLSPLTWDKVLGGKAKLQAETCKNEAESNYGPDTTDSTIIQADEYMSQEINKRSIKRVLEIVWSRWVYESPAYEALGKPTDLDKCAEKCSHYVKAISEKYSKIGCALSRCNKLCTKAKTICIDRRLGFHQGLLVNCQFE